MVNERVPPKGRIYVQEGDDVVAKVQELIPNMIVKHVVFWRGVNRIQPALADTRPKEIPLRYTVVVKRAGGGIVADTAPEDWSRIPKYKRGSGCVPAKIARTAYGSRPLIRERGENSSNSVQAAAPAVSATPPPERPNAAVPLAPQVQHAAPEAIEMQDGQAEVEPSGVPVDVVQGYPPRAVPRHGPGYLVLTTAQKTELSRLHHNLGHPSVELFVEVPSREES